MNRIVIITSYLDALFAFENCINSNDYVICADGGYDIARQHGIVPDLLMGDFDSVTCSLPADIETETFPPEKDFTDLELAVKKAVSLEASEVCIIGGIGGRLDHTIASIQILSRYCGCFDRIYILDGRNECFAAEGCSCSEITVPYRENTYISLFSLSDKCCDVSVRNTKYTLEDYTMSRNIPLGVSNEFTEGKDAVISVAEGTILIVLSKK